MPPTAPPNAPNTANSGILYVTMQPAPFLPLPRFHDWYNNEHGPGRLRLPFVPTGFRYRAADALAPSPAHPEWMAVYDIADMAELTRETYTRLRAPPVQSARERDTMKDIAIRRRFYDAVPGAEWAAPGYVELEAVGQEGTKGRVLVAVLVTLREGQEAEREERLGRWYAEEHVGMLQKVPGWLRTRRFVTSRHETAGGKREFLALHEYEAENGVGGEVFREAVGTAWAKEIFEEVLEERVKRVYGSYYTFGPAPRDLGCLESGEVVPAESTDGKTRTRPKKGEKRAVIESYVTTKDGVELPYRLEGASDPQAPLIVLCNSILVQFGIWDAFVDAFLERSENKKFRILRYNTRGRSSNSGSQPVTVDLLASDILSLLDALRVPRAAAVIGVSLGGATALTVGLKYPDRVATFVACDTNANSPAGNSKAWGERIAIAEKEGAQAQGEAVVGDELAEATVRRWFVKESYDGAKTEAEIERVKKMVGTNSLAGFKHSVQALFDYDLREEMKSYTGEGAFLVGGGDGVLPQTMKDMSESLGQGAPYFVVEGAGHLPMVEKPEQVALYVSEFLY
ncbi:alpha/beta-hydrolase [Mytilinidion resinicola]|uniref:Alpha/beta-hydrolase n=1 Tax=Mytilinidion resinicola TaxID=574789 RepID=A0A6A6YEE5_9PEZI|nr:alpha/beta-hydrolase [Mytilinidion resinicola]KAF2807191.1 alpha/beta-hydrolase [Mytilinidion resinicola]